MAEKHQLQGREREEALGYLAKLEKLSNLPDFPDKIREQIVALAELFIPSESELSRRAALVEATNSPYLRRTKLDEASEILDSRGGILIRALADEIGPDLYPELLQDIREIRAKIRNAHEASDERFALIGEDITEAYLDLNYSDFFIWLHSLNEEGIKDAFIKVDWEVLKSRGDVGHKLAILKSLTDSPQSGISIKAAIVSTAAQRSNEILKIDGSGNVLQSQNVQWIRKRKS